MSETPRRRSILVYGLRLVVTVPGALLWTYALNLGLALVFSLRLHAQLASILDHSLAAERLNSAFDFGTLQAVLHRMSYMAPDTGDTSYAGLPLYLIGYFILVPGTLFCYQSAAPSRLPILVSSGISYFWRFVRITLLTVAVSLILLGPLMAVQAAWTAHVNDHVVGRSALLQKLPGWLVIFLVASLLRLYFDLVEVYTVQLGDRCRADGRQDRRVHRVLLPALRTLFSNFGRAYFSFVWLMILGFAILAIPSRIAMHMLAQPRVWPMFLLGQAGLFGMMATRFWQRGAETILACDNPLPLPPLPPTAEPLALAGPPIRYSSHSGQHHTADALSDPEPAVPSLDEPDPGVFGHEPPAPEEKA